MLNKMFKIKGIGGGGKSPFSQLDLILKSFIQDAFYRFLKFKVIFEIQAMKVGDRNRFLMGGAN